MLNALDWFVHSPSPLLLALSCLLYSVLFHLLLPLFAFNCPLAYLSLLQNVDNADATIAIRLHPGNGTDKTIGYAQVCVFAAEAFVSQTDRQTMRVG